MRDLSFPSPGWRYTYSQHDNDRTEVLQVEDDDASSFVFRELFEEICPDIRLQRARNGVEALTIIRDINKDPSVRLDLVLLDVFLPLINGFEVLASIRAVESFREIPVVVFTVKS